MRYYSDYNKGISLIAEATFCTAELNTKNNISKLFNVLLYKTIPTYVK